jgi:hypothetical protein
VQRRKVLGYQYFICGVVDPHWFQCGSGSSFYVSADPDTDLDPGSQTNADPDQDPDQT